MLVATTPLSTSTRRARDGRGGTLKRQRTRQLNVRCFLRATVTLAVLALGAPFVGQTAAQAGGPISNASMSVSPESAAPGQSVYVAAYSFPPSTNFQLEVCGDDALQGSTDCALSGSITRTTSDVGRFAANLLVLMPPVPCPCVVAAFSSTLAEPIVTGLVVSGAPIAPLTQAAPPVKLKVQSAVLEGSGPAAAWFGAAPKRTLVLRVRNTATVPVASPIVVARIGNTPVPADNLPGIAAGQVRTYRIPVDFWNLAFGQYTVVGQVGAGNGHFARFTVGVLLLPWALLAFALVIIIGLILLAIRRRSQRHARRTAEPPGTTAGTEQAVPAARSPEPSM